MTDAMTLSHTPAGAAAGGAQPARATVPDLTVVVPTYNERANVAVLAERLATVLAGLAWEVVFVDDDSPDGTADAVRALAARMPQVRLLHRVGRRGLSGACIEGILNAQAPVVAVMDADLQHDEAALPAMFAALAADSALDLVIGSRHVDGGTVGQGLSALRRRGSDGATRLARRVLGLRVSDPMSGFFMVRRSAFIGVVLDLQRQGFKILADMLSASGGRWKVAEVPYTFRPRHAGASKLDGAVTLEFLGLLVSRLTGGLLPIRFVLFLAVGATGILVQLAGVRLAMLAAGGHFGAAQVLGVGLAMTTNFAGNNALTWRDRRLRGRAFLRGLLSFYAVCAVGAVGNVIVARALYRLFPDWLLASLGGAAVGAVWNFWASLTVTWKAR